MDNARCPNCNILTALLLWTSAQNRVEPVRTPKNWKRTDNARCPNCNILREDKSHLMVCHCPDRFRLFREQVVIIKELMESHFTHPHLWQLVGQYLRKHSTRRFKDLKAHTSRTKSRAAAQDKIGWRHFTEGKLALQVRQIQRVFLYNSDTSLTVDSWLKGFVSKLLEMTHAQWIFWCIRKHHRTERTIVLKTTKDLLQEAEWQLSMGVDNMSEDDRWMLELDMD